MKEIFIKKTENIAQIVLLENGNVIEQYEENDKKKRLEGKIYLGRVQNVLQGMQAAFIDIGEDRNTIEDVYEPYLLQLGFINRTPRGRIAMPSAYEYFKISK